MPNPESFERLMEEIRRRRMEYETGRISWGEYLRKENELYEVYTTKNESLPSSLPSDRILKTFVASFQTPSDPWTFTKTEANLEPYNAATMLWNENDGVMVCECDNPDCFEPLNIGKAAYIQASGPGGHYRVTSPKCVYGCTGYTLLVRRSDVCIWSQSRL